MKLFIQIIMMSFIIFLVSCASTGRKPYGEDLQYSSAKKMPGWTTDMRRIRKSQKDRIYFQGIGENISEKLANDEAGRDAALQFSRYIMTQIKAGQQEHSSSENIISKILSEKTEEQLTHNFATQQYLVERYIEKRMRNEYDKPVEYFRIYALYSFPKLQSINILKDVSSFLKAHKTADDTENNYFNKAASKIDELINEIEKNEAFIINVR